jgi:hypothetical protein
MPLKEPENTNTPSSGSKENGHGRRGEERTASAPELLSSKPNGSPINVENLVLPPLKFSNKKWFIYKSECGCFEQRDENTICHLVQQQCEGASSYQIRDRVSRIRFLVDYLDRFHPAIRYDEEDILNNVLNGVVRIKPNGLYGLEKHDSKWCFDGVLPVNFDETALCPVFLQELQDKLPFLDQKLVLFFGAYCLIPDCRFGVTLFNYGPSHTGKSTIIVHGLGAVFGDLTSSLKLSEICPESYSGLSHVPVLKDKLLNIGAEVDGREVRDTTNFKRLISGEAVRAREAFERGGEISTYAKLTFNMNELPKINGTSAEIDRIRLIHFNKVHEDERDYTIEQKIKLEGSGMYMLFLRQERELLRLNIFPHGSVNSQVVYSQLRNKIDPYKHFMKTYENELELGDDLEFTMETHQLDTFIVDYLQANNYVDIFTIDVFKRRLYARFNIENTQQWLPRGVPRQQQKRHTILHGIRIKPN